MKKHKMTKRLILALGIIGLSVTGVRADSVNEKEITYADLRLKNLEVNYQIPKRWLQPLRLTKLQVYVNGTNLLTFSKGDSRRDPEHSGQNVYPVVRRYNIGFRLGL